MLARRDPAPGTALLVLALFLGFGSASARLLDFGGTLWEASSRLLSEASAALLGQDPAYPTASVGAESSQGTDGGGGTADAGVIIDPNGSPKP